MKMKRHSSPTSPYARKVRVLAAELGPKHLPPGRRRATGTPSLVEVVAGVARSYLLRLRNPEWRKSREALAQWHAPFTLRPSMAQTVPPGR